MALVASPAGDIVEGPLYDEEGMLIVDCDLRQTVRAKYGFDAVGHYGREDVLLPLRGAADAMPADLTDFHGQALTVSPD